MAAGALPAPGTKYGPCVESCEHLDCAQTLKMSDTICRLCGERIGYETRFYQEGDWQKLVHAVCLEDAIDADRKDREAIST